MRGNRLPWKWSRAHTGTFDDLIYFHKGWSSVFPCIGTGGQVHGWPWGFRFVWAHMRVLIRVKCLFEWRAGGSWKRKGAVYGYENDEVAHPHLTSFQEQPSTTNTLNQSYVTDTVTWSLMTKAKFLFFFFSLVPTIIVIVRSLRLLIMILHPCLQTAFHCGIPGSHCQRLTREKLFNRAIFPLALLLLLPWYSWQFSGARTTMCVCDDCMCSAVRLSHWSVCETGAFFAIMNSFASSDIAAFISLGDYQTQVFPRHTCPFWKLILLTVLHLLFT